MYFFISFLIQIRIQARSHYDLVAKSLNPEESPRRKVLLPPFTERETEAEEDPQEMRNSGLIESTSFPTLLPSFS